MQRSSSLIGKALWIMAGSAVVGAGLDYFLDPRLGRQRRRRLRAKATRYFHESDHALARALRDAGNRAAGLVAEWEGRLGEEAVDDDTLVERIRSKMGRAVRHPSLVRVTTSGGRAHLRGTVEATELRGLLRCVGRVRGVRRVTHQLTSGAGPGIVDISRLPGRRRGAPSHLAPASQLGLLCAAGGGLALFARQRWSRVALGTLGAGLAISLTRRNRAAKPTHDSGAQITQLVPRVARLS